MDARLLLNTAPTDRYDGRPFLRLVECYVLWSIGQLSKEHERVLDELTPKLQETFHTTGSWQDVVAGEMALPEELPQALRAMWQRNVELAAKNATPLDAEAWVREVVDRNLA